MSVRQKIKGILAYVEKFSMVIATNLTFIVASIRRKWLKTTHTEVRSIYKNSESCNIRLRSLKNQFHFKQIIQILQPIIIDFVRLQLVFTAGAGFSNIPGKYENVVLIIKNPRNRKKRFQK